MRISRHDLRRRYSNALVIDVGSHFTLRACSQATRFCINSLILPFIKGLSSTWILTDFKGKNASTISVVISKNLLTLSFIYKRHSTRVTSYIH